MPTRSEMVLLYAGLNMQSFLGRDMDSGAAYKSCADRARRSAMALVQDLQDNVPGLIEDDGEERYAELQELRAELRILRDDLATARQELAAARRPPDVFTPAAPLVDAPTAADAKKGSR